MWKYWPCTSQLYHCFHCESLISVHKVKNRNLRHTITILTYQIKCCVLCVYIVLYQVLWVQLGCIVKTLFPLSPITFSWSVSNTFGGDFLICWLSIVGSLQWESILSHSGKQIFFIQVLSGCLMQYMKQFVHDFFFNILHKVTTNLNLKAFDFCCINIFNRGKLVCMIVQALDVVFTHILNFVFLLWILWSKFSTPLRST